MSSQMSVSQVSGTGPLEISFTTLLSWILSLTLSRSTLTYYSYTAPDPCSWQYSGTFLNNNIKIAIVLVLYGLLGV
jgi:hypothetical protein